MTFFFSRRSLFFYILAIIQFSCELLYFSYFGRWIFKKYSNMAYIFEFRKYALIGQLYQKTPYMAPKYIIILLITLGCHLRDSGVVLNRLLGDFLLSSFFACHSSHLEPYWWLWLITQFHEFDQILIFCNKIQILSYITELSYLTKSPKRTSCRHNVKEY